MAERLHVPVGKRFGRLVVLGMGVPNKQGRSRWLCRCDCGAQKEILAGKLTCGNTRSCGCLRREVCAERARERNEKNVKHGLTRVGTRHPLYWTWTSMLRRCQVPTRKDYKNYGGRGIRVCKRWEEFDLYLADVMAEIGPKPGSEYSIDRIDNEGNYEPGNIRWATPKQQVNNRRVSKKS